MKKNFTNYSVILVFCTLFTACASIRNKNLEARDYVVTYTKDKCTRQEQEHYYVNNTHPQRTINVELSVRSELGMTIKSVKMRLGPKESREFGCFAIDNIPILMPHGSGHYLEVDVIITKATFLNSSLE